MGGIGLVQTLCLLGIYLLDELGRDSSPQFPVTYLCMAQHQGTGGHYGTLAHYGMVEHCGTHAYQGSVLHLTSVQRDTVAYGNVIAQDAGSLAVQGVYATVVLYIGTVANLYKVYVAPYHGIEPYGAVVTHLYVAYYYCTF